MKRLFALFLLAVLLCAPALADTNLDVEVSPEGIVIDDTWTFTGYTFGGVTFAVPAESWMYELTDEERAQGYIFILGNDDYMLQLRSFQPEEMTFSAFFDLVSEEPTAESQLRDVDGHDIFSYRNTSPSAWGELYGIALKGLDGNLYKISFFTGESERFDDDAPVWRIAEIVDQTTRIQDFAEWGIQP